VLLEIKKQIEQKTKWVFLSPCVHPSKINHKYTHTRTCVDTHIATPTHLPPSPHTRRRGREQYLSQKSNSNYVGLNFQKNFQTCVCVCVYVNPCWKSQHSMASINYF